MKLKGIKAILFDSGRVLNYPSSGNWFITPNFFEHVDKNIFERIEDMDKYNAFRKALSYIDKNKLIKTREEEYYHFVKFYGILSGELPILNLSDEKIELIAKDLVYNNNKYTFYEDALEIIPKLYNRYQLGIVSDAWPSLLNVYEEASLIDYFRTFIISSIHGILKPDSKMFTLALEELNILPSEAIFIDDNYKNCEGAKKVGIKPILLNREKDNIEQTKYTEINSLIELLHIL
ncbi:haloacid dehalogenase [Vallitalea longa]|uniref:Haloacid dehalogenase n=1 Tax=Vallitalea longa TaxID=2936439 RepID=A0A9W5Y901_9FIRM|nr:HAD-IA family hydrolase [Vallitalea longa]GKX29452.1 haloacid dehalogenase [Vallitalea longa]